MRMADAVAAEVLGVASVRRAILAGGEIATLMAAGGEGAAGGEDRVGERAAEALRHQHDDAHARVELSEELARLLDGELLVPEHDAVVGQVVLVLLAVVGDVEEQGVARAQLLALGGEPGVQGLERRRLEGVAVDRRVDELHRPQQCRGARRQQPRVAGVVGARAGGEVGARIGAVGGEDGDVVGVGAVRLQELDERADVREVRLEVALLLAAAVDQQGLEGAGSLRDRLRGRRAGRRRRAAGAQADEEDGGDGERQGGAQERITHARSRCSRGSAPTKPARPRPRLPPR